MSASAGVTDLTFQLIDLDPNDGVTPFITWVGGVPSENGLSEYIYGSTSSTIPFLEPRSYNGLDMSSQELESFSAAPGLPGTWQPTSINGQTGSQTQVVLSPNGMRVQSSITTDDLITVTTPPDVTQTSYTSWDGSQRFDESTSNSTTWTAAGASASVGSRVTEGTPTTVGFTLSPNTLLMVRGTMAVSAEADFNSFRDAVRGSTYESQGDDAYTNMTRDGWTRLEARAQVALGDLEYMAYGPDELLDNGVLFSQYGLDQTASLSVNPYGTLSPSAYYGLDGLPENGMVNRSASKDFVLTLSAIGPNELNGALLFDIYSDTHQFVSSNTYSYSRIVTDLGPDQTALPEPGTWALMLLGLGGVAAAARRRTA